MCSKIRITESTASFSADIKRLGEELCAAEAVVIGAGAGLSASAGFTYSGERFQKFFADFEEKYGFRDMYSGGFYPYETLEEYWAYWSRHVYVNRYTDAPKPAYDMLREIVKDKNYFVVTTNVDHCFQKAGFDKRRLFYTQGDYGLWQCSKACHNKTYDNESTVRQMTQQQKDMKIPSELIPKCPMCGAPMTMNLRCDDTFVQDEGWYAAAERYKEFIVKYQNSRVLFLELGVGMNTPVIIKYPFWQMTYENLKSFYVNINLEGSCCPREIQSRALCIDSDILNVLIQLKIK